jgi:hypothetical protein
MRFAGPDRAMRMHLLATRGHLTAAEQLESVVPWLAGRVTPIAYDTLFRGMTPAYWWRQAKESYWDVERYGWASRREALQAAATLGVRLLRYLGAPRRRRPGTYIFADLEQLSPGELQKAAVVWQALAGAGAGVRLVNHPARSMRRYELLRTLHAGPISPLLRTRGELEAAVDVYHRQGEVRDGLMIVEFCDTADADGIYRKYSAFVIGDHVFVKSVMFSRHWIQKHRDLDEPGMLREERQYVEENPHEEALREIFRLAGIDYGRMDYGLLHGKVQVWEINTNPVITGSLVSRSVERRPIHEHFARKMADALERLARS